MKSLAAALFLTVILSTSAYAGGGHKGDHKDNQCVAAGPQSPRDIAVHDGTNGSLFLSAPDYAEMNLCNVHFHRNAEHKAPAYSTFVKDGDNSGWACSNPTADRLAKGSHVTYEGCEGIAPGDTIEVHWVYTTCDTETKGAKPLGGGLSACLTEVCSNPQLRVEAQVFKLSTGSKLKFNDVGAGNTKDRYSTLHGLDYGNELQQHPLLSLPGELECEELLREPRYRQFRQVVQPQQVQRPPCPRC